MANPTYFTVVADFKSVVVDLASDVDADPQLGPVTAKVTFTPVLANGDVILASTASPRPTMFVPAPIVARIDTDGRLKLRVEPDGDRDDFATRSAFPSTGNITKVYFAIDTQTFYRWTGSLYAETYPYAQVRLLADTALLGLDSDLYYRVTFSEVIFNGAPGYINGFTFQAPTSDVELNLVNVARVPGQPAVGTTKGDKGDRGYSFVGLSPAGDGSSVVGLIESSTGVIPAGDPVPISLSYNSTVTHSNVPLTPRPPVSVAVIWIGSVEPTYAIDGDVWMDTSGTAPTITTTTLNGMNVNASFSQVLVASGTTPIVWSVFSGTLPAGLTFSTDGNLYGAPTATGSYTFTLKALNAFGSGTRQFTGTVGAAIAPTITTTTLGSTVTGTPFSLTLTISGSTPVTFAVQSGSLPTGLSLGASTGIISGTPTTVASYSFTIRATNAVGYDDQAFTGSVTGVAPTITTTSIGPLYRAFAVSETVSTSGSTPVTFAVQSGSLPAGLSLNTSTGVISGTPTTVASYSFTIRATNSYGTDDQAFTVSVLQSTPVIIETELTPLRLNTAFAQTLTLTTGGPTITWTVQSGTLPVGLSLNASTGAISGTPTVEGSYSFTIRASNGVANDDQAFTGSVAGLGPSFVSISSAMSANTSITAAAGSKVIVLVHYYAPPAGLTATPVFTLGGVNMTNKGYGASSFASSYSSYTFAFEGTANGSAQLIGFPSVGAWGQTAYAVVFNNVTAVGSAQASNYYGYNPALQNVTSATNHLVLQSFWKASGGAWSGYSQTQRAAQTGIVVGTATGGTTVNFSANTGTLNADNYTIGLAVDLS